MASFTFDKKRRTYFRDGRPVPPETLRAWVIEVMTKAREELGEVTEDFTSGGINRAAWALRMRSLISRSHGAVWMLAQGGKNAMSAKEWGSVGQKIKAEADYLRGFERDIANEVAGTEAALKARAEMYANALNNTFAAALVSRERAAGVKRFLRVLGAPQTGNCRDCPDLAGEYDAGELILPGEQSECGGACNCYVVSVEAEGVAA